MKTVYDNEILLIKLLNETFEKSVKIPLDKNYFSEFQDVKKWKCYSDYAVDGNKPNSVITFTLLPHVVNPNFLSETINYYAPKDIKKTRNVNAKFIDFIRKSPFVSFSFILKNDNHVYIQNKEGFKNDILKSMNMLLDTIPNWTAENPNLEPYHKEIIKKTKQVIRLVNDNKKIKILKNLFLITSIGSYICTQFANKTNAEIFGWFSDRDEINDVADHYASDLFNIQFNAYLKNRNCQFISSRADSNTDDWYGDFIKIPDFISGTLADFDLETKNVSHKKFLPVLRDLICDNERNVFIFEINFKSDNTLECSRIKYYKED